MLINKIQTAQDMSNFLTLDNKKLDETIQKAPEQTLQILSDAVWGLCMKMNLPQDEAKQFVEKVRGRSMGYLFENMEKIDIQAERKENAKLKKEREKMSSEIMDMHGKIASMEDEFLNIKNKLSNTKDELSNAKDELSNAKDELSNTKDELSNTKDELSTLQNELAEKDLLIEKLKHELSTQKE